MIGKNLFTSFLLSSTSSDDTEVKCFEEKTAENVKENVGSVG